MFYISLCLNFHLYFIYVHVAFVAKYKFNGKRIYDRFYGIFISIFHFKAEIK
jgi:hypothetical protein